MARCATLPLNLLQPGPRERNRSEAAIRPQEATAEQVTDEVGSSGPLEGQGMVDSSGAPAMPATFSPEGSATRGSSIRTVDADSVLPRTLGEDERSRAGLHGTRDYAVDRFFALRGLETFDHNRIKEAYKACKQDFYSAINNRQSLVILDNVNCERWHYQHEIEAARRMGYSVRIWEFQAQSNDDLYQCWRRNRHGISERQFMAFYSRWEVDPNAQLIPILHTV